MLVQVLLAPSRKIFYVLIRRKMSNDKIHNFSILRRTGYTPADIYRFQSLTGIAFLYMSIINLKLRVIQTFFYLGFIY